MRIPRDWSKLPFSPSDWLVLAALGIVTIAALLWFLAATTLHFTIEVPARGGTYHEGIVGTPRFINPVLAVSDADRDLTALIFAGLLKSLPDGSLVPDVAASYTVSDDKRTFAFVIRDDAVFQDGTPITADDVAYTIARAQNPAIKSPKRANWEGVEVSVSDSKNISFTLKEPYAPFLNNMTIGILPKHLWAGVSDEEFPFSTLNTNPVGEGPYKLQKMTTNAAGIPIDVALSAWSGGRFSPYITHIDVTFFSDQEALIVAASRDSSLAVHSVSPTKASGQAIHEAVLGRIFGVFFNQNQNNIFANKAVRQALDRALDKNAIVSTLIAGYGTALRGPLPPKTVEPEGATASTSEDRILAAQALLEKDGWAKGDDGIYAKKVKKATTRLAFTLVTGNAPELKGAAEAVAKAWQSLGVEVTTQFFEQNDLQQDVIRPRKYDALLFGEVIGHEQDLFAFWHSSQRNDPGLNIGEYANISVDKALVEARTTEDPEARLNKTLEAAQIIQDEVAAIFLYAPHFIYLTPSSLNGMTLGTIATPSDRFMSVTNWYLTTERVWPIFSR